MNSFVPPFLSQAPLIKIALSADQQNEEHKKLTPFSSLPADYIYSLIQSEALPLELFLKFLLEFVLQQDKALEKLSDMLFDMIFYGEGNHYLLLLKQTLELTKGSSSITSPQAISQTFTIFCRGEKQDENIHYFYNICVSEKQNMSSDIEGVYIAFGDMQKEIIRRAVYKLSPLTNIVLFGTDNENLLNLAALIEETYPKLKINIFITHSDDAKIPISLQTEKTKIFSIPFMGHSSESRNTIFRAHLCNVLKENGVVFNDNNAIKTEIEILECYAEQQKKLLPQRGSNFYNNTFFPHYFVNETHRGLFKKNYPVLYNWLFEVGSWTPKIKQEFSLMRHDNPKAFHSLESMCFTHLPASPYNPKEERPLICPIDEIPPVRRGHLCRIPTIYDDPGQFTPSENFRKVLISNLERHKLNYQKPNLFQVLFPIPNLFQKQVDALFKDVFDILIMGNNYSIKYVISQYRKTYWFKTPAFITLLDNFERSIEEYQKIILNPAIAEVPHQEAFAPVSQPVFEPTLALSPLPDNPQNQEVDSSEIPVEIIDSSPPTLINSDPNEDKPRPLSPSKLMVSGDLKTPTVHISAEILGEIPPVLFDASPTSAKKIFASPITRGGRKNDIEKSPVETSKTPQSTSGDEDTGRISVLSNASSQIKSLISGDFVSTPKTEGKKSSFAVPERSSSATINFFANKAKLLQKDSKTTSPKDHAHKLKGYLSPKSLKKHFNTIVNFFPPSLGSPDRGNKDKRKMPDNNSDFIAKNVTAHKK
jgi:hypothetical protein